MVGVFLGNCQSVNVIVANIDPANIATATTTEQTFAVPGVKVGDFVSVAKPTLTAGIAIGSARVSAANTVAITFVTTATNINAPAEDYMFLVVRPEKVGATRIVS